MTFGEKMKKLRAENGLTQEQLADKLFVTRTAVSKWETNKGLPSIDVLKEIAALFGISMDALISDEDINSKKLADERRAKIFYVLAIVCLAATVAFTLTTYFTGNVYYSIGSCGGAAGYMVFALLSKPKYRRLQAKKVILPYLISRLIILAVVAAAIVATIVML